MTPEQETPILSIEHWNYQMAKEVGHPEIGEIGMFVDVAVFRRDGEIVGVRKIKQLKIHWEKFKKDEIYAAEMLASAEKLIEGREASGRVLRVFSYWKDYFLKDYEKGPNEASRRALFETLDTPGLNQAQVNLKGLDRGISGQIAEALIEVSEPYLREVVEEFSKGKAGDSLEALNFLDPRAKRILSAAKRKLNPR